MDLPEEDFSRDPEVVKAINNDPLVYHGNGPAHTAKELLNATAKIQDEIPQIDVPFITMHGQKDKLTMWEGSADLFQRAKSKVKTLKLYQNAYHDLLHEPEKEKVYGDMLAWLEGRTSSAAAPENTTIKQ
jgi:alpha-beta hydrolase superfamily lysophospholipase